jgi:hypothetical protein
MADRNAADMELDERDGLLNNDHRGRKLPSILRERGNSFRGLALHALHTFVVCLLLLCHILEGIVLSPCEKENQMSCL